MSSRRKVLLFGLGGIGARYDQGLPAERILTHARAIRGCPSLEITAGFDPDPQARSSFEQAFSVPSFASLDSAPSKLLQGVSVVVAATPTRMHAETVQTALRLQPALVLCEKPVALSLAVTEEMQAGAQASGIPVFVNYFRRCLPAIQALKAKLGSGHHGRLRKCVVWYSGGLLNNGSHFVDLLRFLFGEFDSISPAAGSVDRRPGDPAVDFTARLAGAPVHFLSCQVCQADYFELDLWLENTRITIKGDEIWQCLPEADPIFSGYTTLSAKPADVVYLETGRALLFVWRSIEAWLADKKDALAPLSLAEAVRSLESTLQALPIPHGGAS